MDRYSLCMALYRSNLKLIVRTQRTPLGALGQAQSNSWSHHTCSATTDRYSYERIGMGSATPTKCCFLQDGSSRYCLPPHRDTPQGVEQTQPPCFLCAPQGPPVVDSWI